jgi:hypothetical protein
MRHGLLNFSATTLQASFGQDLDPTLSQLGSGTLLLSLKAQTTALRHHGPGPRSPKVSNWRPVPKTCHAAGFSSLSHEQYGRARTGQASAIIRP